MSLIPESLDYRRLFHSAPGPFLLLRKDGEFTVVDVNDAYLRIAGLARESLIGRPATDRPLVSATSLRESLRRVAASGAPEAMAEHAVGPAMHTSGASAHRWRATNTPVLSDDGDVIYIVHRLEAVPSSARAPAAAAEFTTFAMPATRLLAAIVQSSDDAIVSKNLDGIIVSWNAGAQRLFGYQPHEVIGKHISILIPEDRLDEEPGILQRIRAGHRVEHYETVRRRKDGSFIDISLTVSPVHDDAGHVVGASKIARDISQRKQAEKTQQLLLGELNHRIKNTLATVQAIMQQTLRTTENPGDFAARFSGRIHALARVHSLLTATTWHGAGLDELIRDQLLHGPVDETRLTAKGPAVRLGSQMTVHLALVLHELGTNSAKYGALSAPRGTVAVTWSVDGEWLRLRWVERGGPAPTPPSRRGFGTTLIEASAKGEGGSATMRCEPDGVVWDITLPMPRTDEREPMAAAGDPRQRSDTGHQGSALADLGPRAPLAGRRLLVVEDEPLIALDIVGNLQKAGAASISQVGTVADALQIVERGDFDAALLDGNLHGQPVDPIAAALARRRIPFAFVTGYRLADLPAAFKDAPTLSKPVSDQQLVDAVLRLATADTPKAAQGRRI